MSETNHTTGPAAIEAVWPTWRTRIYRGYAAGVGVCLAMAFVESFRNLVTYFERSGYHGLYAVIAPTMVDIFTIGGETLVLLATVDRWERRYKAAGWTATAVGLAVSVAGNAGKDGWTVTAARGARHLIPLTELGTFAIPPLAMAGLLALGLMIVKRALHPAVPGHTSGGGEIPGDALVALTLWPDHARSGTLPPYAEIRKRLSCGQPRAERIRAYLTELYAAFAPGAEDDVDRERVAG
jgi:hypothetical protein